MRPAVFFCGEVVTITIGAASLRGARVDKMEKQADGGLAELHRLLVAARDVQEEMERGPRQLKARQQTIAQKQADLEAQRQKHKALRMSADQRSLQLKSNEAKIGELKIKLHQAASNRE